MDIKLPLHETDNELPPENIKIMLIGLGPFAKRHYFKFFKRHQFFPEFIIDLESKGVELKQFLESNQLNIPLYLIPDKFRDTDFLEEEQKHKIKVLLIQYHVTHAILTTEPKAHLAYLNFLIENGIHVLVEKPLTAPQNCSFSIQSAEKIEMDYSSISNKMENSPREDLRVDLHCQRRYHPIYQFVQQQIEGFVKEFDIPITYCDIYHCDGMWNMPDEFLFRDNHPYKYGYGKLLHSGYHFIDLLAFFLKTSFKCCTKVPDYGEMYGTAFSPLDSLMTFNQKDHSRFFGNEECKEIFDNPHSFDFQKFGELDFFSILQLFQGERKITTCNINLLQTGFCRRAWSDLPEDTYKGNGRIRHERINLQFGPLFNIQVHSYLSSESKEPSLRNPSSVGESRHFDVLLFRNSDLIGGKPFELFNSTDFIGTFEEGFNEVSRIKCLLNFLHNRKSLSRLQEHKLSIKLLSKSLKTLCHKNADQISIERFELTKKDFALSEELMNV